MSSVMMPVKVCLAGPEDWTARSRSALAIRNFMEVGPVLSDRPSKKRLLEPWDHQMRGARARVHDPDPALLRVVGQSHRLRGRAWHGNRRVRAGGFLVLAHQVVPHRPEFGLHARAI